MESETKMQVVNLTVVRHGQSEANIAKTLQKASPLSEAGKEQARLAGIALKDAAFDQIYSSPQERAFETALWILKNNDKMVHDDAIQTIDKGASLKKIPIGIQTTPVLRERDFGVYDSKTYAEFKKASQEAGYENDRYYRPDGGENEADVMKRVDEFMDSFLKSLTCKDDKALTKNVLITTHCGWMWRLAEHLLQYNITHPEKHCSDFQNFKSGAKIKIHNTAIFNFELLVDTRLGKLVSYICTECNSGTHLDSV